MLGHLNRDTLERRLMAFAAVTLVTLTVGLALGPASAQPGEPNDTDSSDPLDDGKQNGGLWRVRLEHSIQHEHTPPNPLEEVRVRAPKPLFAYRRDVEAAQDRVWDAFNKANSSDEFDVGCSHETPTGTRIPQYVCRPEFLDDATSRAARAFKYGSIGLQQIEASRAHYMERRLGDEMRGLAISDPELQERLGEFDEALENYEEARSRRR